MRTVLLLVLTAGCRQLLGFENPTVASSDGPAVDPDAAITCFPDDQTCPAKAPICAEGVCVECVGTEGVCGGEQPVCGADLHCRACVSHDECTSEVCLINGACADPLQVAYIEPNTLGDCSQTNPCARVALGMQTGKPILKVTGTVTDIMSANLNRTIDLYGAPGAVITRAINGQVIDTSSLGIVSLHDLTLSGGTSNTGNGIRSTQGTLVLDRVRVIGNEGLGLDIRGGELVMSRAIVQGNANGGARIENTKFAISNSLFVQNGTAGSTIGGLKIKPVVGSSFELNTIADNTNDDLSATTRGLDCDAAFEAHSNIVVNNALGPGCTFHDSLFNSAVIPAGSNNLIGDAKFITTLGPTSDGFYRISPGSAARDGGISTITFDIDGQPRPAGAAPDMGADELP